MEITKLETHHYQILLSIEPVLAMFKNDDRYDKLGHIASAIGSTRRSIYRWEAEGLPIVTAEKIAETLGIHPTLIWGPEYHTAIYYEEIRTECRDKARKEKLRLKSKKRYWAGKEKIA